MIRADGKDCDFCGVRGVAWRFPCRPFRAYVPGHGVDYRGDWACCEECRPLFEEERWEAHELTAGEIEEPRAYIRQAFGSITVNPATGKQWDPARVALQPA